MARRVLFVHGLESGPFGFKYRQLRAAGFEVVSEHMPCDRMSILKDPVFFSTAATLLLVPLYIASLAHPMLALAVLAGELPMVYGFKHLYVRRLINRCTSIQAQALKKYPDISVVIGSSFGGAIACELLRTGAWHGPTLLLASAQHKLAELARLPMPTLPAGVRCVVVHGLRDTVVPLAHSHMLAAKESKAVALIEVDDTHGLGLTSKETLAAWIAQAVGTAVDATPAE